MQKTYLAVFGVLAMLLASAASAQAQDLSSLSSDLGTFLGGVGQGILPSMLQSAVAEEGIGAASMGDSHVLVALEAGATLASTGPLAVLDQSPTPFSIVDPQSLRQGLAASSTLESYLKVVEGLPLFPYPGARLVAGYKPGDGVEILAFFSYLPQALTAYLAGRAGAGGAGIRLQSVSGVLRVRKVLVADSGPFPAISLGVGYAYSMLSADYALHASQSYSSSYTLSYGGTLDLRSQLNAVGVDLAFSKRWFHFTPYLRLSPWYEWASYTGEVKNFAYSLTTSSGGAVSGVTPPASSTPSASKSLRGLSFLVAGGVEINLGGFSIVPSGSFDLTNESFGAALSTRYQF